MRGIAEHVGQRIQLAVAEADDQPALPPTGTCMSIPVNVPNRSPDQAAVSARGELEGPQGGTLLVGWVGADPESDNSECPAVAVMPETGDFLFRGKTVTDPVVITALNQHIGKAEDESDVWLPARMASLIREALDGYEEARCGPGQHTVAELIAGSSAVVVRFTLADGDDQARPGTGEPIGDSGCQRWGGDLDPVRAAVARGVTVRGLQVLPAPPPGCDRHGHGHASGSRASGDVRWLPTARAVDLLLPGADCWVFDYRVVRWDFPGGSSGPRCCAFSSDPRIIRDIAAAFEIAWSRALEPSGDDLR
jgi:hypothetical protein